ncbi:MAG: LON peptidase substrate-binding domain-containing protein [Saprospiraceae bacterium]
MLEILPLFPLQLVVFTNENLNLHIFEPRYKQLLNEAEQEGITFGIPAFIDGKLMNFGTEVELLKVADRAEDGKLNVKTRGIGVFEMREFFQVLPDKLYGGGKVERLNDESVGDLERNDVILAHVQKLFSVLKIDKDIPENSIHFRVFDMGHHVGFSLKQEYQFLCLRSEVERQEFMLAHLKRLIPIVDEMEQLKERVRMNGHFKNLKPPNF